MRKKDAKTAISISKHGRRGQTRQVFCYSKDLLFELEFAGVLLAIGSRSTFR